MGFSQTAYSERHRLGEPGNVAFGDPDILSYQFEGPGDDDKLSFGVAVRQGTGDAQCLAGVAAASQEATSFVGVALVDQHRLGAGAYRAAANRDSYSKGEYVSVLRRGFMFALADGAVTAGQDVTVENATGRLGSKAVSGTHTRVPARWHTSAADGAVAIVDLFGVVPTVTA